MKLYADVFSAQDPHYDSWRRYQVSSGKSLKTFDVYYNFLLISCELPCDVVNYIAYNAFTYDVRYNESLRSIGCIKYMNYFVQNKSLHDKLIINKNTHESIMELITTKSDITFFSTNYIVLSNTIPIYRAGDLFLGLGFINPNVVDMIRECKLCFGETKLDTIFEFDAKYTISDGNTIFYYNKELPVVPIVLLPYTQIYLQITLHAGHSLQSIGEIIMLQALCEIDIRNKLISSIYKSTYNNRTLTVSDGICCYDL